MIQDQKNIKGPFLYVIDVCHVPTRACTYGRAYVSMGVCMYVYICTYVYGPAYDVNLVRLIEK